MASDITVSIITPCYNGAKFLRETLTSAVTQSRPPLEVIVVDDGSTDDSAAIAEGFGPPVRVIRQTNRGESAARNRALAHARGTHVLFLDADDLLDQHALLHATNSLMSLHADDLSNTIACSGFAFFGDDLEKAFCPTFPKATAFYPDVITGNLAPPGCWLTPKELILQAGGFHAPQRYFEDWDLWWRVGLLEVRILPTSFVGFYYRQHVRSQLASVRDAERAYGHAWLLERMCRALLDRSDLMAECGAVLFWQSVVALRTCRQFGVSWKRLRLLATMIEEVARAQPPGLATSRFARAVRVFGMRRSSIVASFWGGGAPAPEYRAKWLRGTDEPVVPEIQVDVRPG